MDPAQLPKLHVFPRLPRTRGDGPRVRHRKAHQPGASPHTRGWTVLARQRPAAEQGFPAHAGMDPARPWARRGTRGLPRTRGDGPRSWCSSRRLREASPHTRGWTRRRQEQHPRRHGFPAHAGMDPCRRTRAASSTRLPRTRGDGPGFDVVICSARWASPHTRGWTHYGSPGRSPRAAAAGAAPRPPRASRPPPPWPRPARPAAWSPRPR